MRGMGHSHLDTAWDVTEMAAATSVWVKPRSVRSLRKISPICSIGSLLCDMIYPGIHSISWNSSKHKQRFRKRLKRAVGIETERRNSP